MSDLLGFVSISLISLVTILIALMKPAISKILYTALILRVLVILIGHYLITLPDSDQDALGLDDLSWTIAQDGFLNVIHNFPGLDSFFHSWFIAILYSLFGRSILMSQSLSLSFGIGIVVLGWLFAKKLWDSHTANKVGWVLALFPSLILYSVLPLRDIYSSFFILVAMFGLFNWTRTRSFFSSTLTIFGFVGAAFFHGALIIGGIFFFIILIISSLKKTFTSLINSRLSIGSFLIIFFGFIVLQSFFSNEIYIPKIGYFTEIDLNLLTSELNTRVIGTGSFSEWTKIQSHEEYIYKVPLRLLFFLFSPLPWQVEKIAHIIGMIDGFFYIFLVYLIFCNRKVIWNNPSLRILSIFLLGYLLMFSIGVGNFGAGIRHRSKFIIEMLLLVGPLLPSFTISRSKLPRLRLLIKKNK